jgi:hypothetical protein
MSRLRAKSKSEIEFAEHYITINQDQDILTKHHIDDHIGMDLLFLNLLKFKSLISVLH